MRKKLTLLFALLCASVMGWATQYCGRVVTTTIDYTSLDVTVTVKKQDANTVRVILDNEHITGIRAGGTFQQWGNGVWANQDDAVANFAQGWTQDGNAWYKDFVFSTYPTTGNFQIYILMDHNAGLPAVAGFTLANIDIDNDCSGGGDPTPDPDPDPTPAPDPDDHTADGHTIHLDASYVGDIYTLVITSTDDMTGLGGSFWYVNGASTDMRSNSGTNSYTVSGDKKTINCQVQSTSAPSIHTPLYVLMPGEVNFGNVTLNWENRGPINSEYCNYQGPETQQDGHYYAITWETDPSGNVVITIGNGTGAGACSFRNGGFEGGNNGLANFVVSDDDFATTTPATDYFTVTRPSDGDLQYVMTKIADLPANAKIKHLSAGAIAWREASADRWCYPEFIYTYGGTCNQLDAPTNVAIDANNILTFDAVAGADSYMAYVSLGGVEKYSQAVASGDELTYTALVTGDYIINVVASGAGKVDSEPSADVVWHLEAEPVVLGNSEYCEQVFMAGDNREAAFTWETDDDGNIVITISATRGDADATHFRGNGMALANFKVGAGKADASTYFNHACGGSNQVTLSLKNPANAPALGEKIYFNQTVEYATSLDGNAWPTLDFEWTYGTVCSGKAVSASVNNNTMGSAVVQKAGVDVTNVDAGDEVSFIATVADPALYRFVNWTKGGVEVSTNATYVTTITETTNLVANFDYIREAYCHAEINSVQNKKLYLTLGSIGGGQYQIKIEGSEEAQLTALTNANYTINWVTTTIEDGDKKMSGQDVPFNNARWAFDASGYGSATAVFGISEGKTWEDIHVWNHAIYFSSPNGEIGYTGFPDRYHIDWNSTCSDAEAPVFDKAEAEVLSESSVRLKIQATDNWGGLLTYTIAREAAEPIISNHASGEEFTQDVTGLTAGTEYTFTVTVSDGVNNAIRNIVVTPIADNVKPEMGEASLESKTWNSAIINVAATDNKGVTAYYVVEKDADYVATEGKITIEGLTAATAYTFHIKAKDAAGNISDNQAEVSFTTDAHSLVPTTAAPVPTWPDDQVISFYSDKYTAPTTWNYRAPWGGTTVYEQVVIAENNVIHYSSFDWAGWEINSGAPYNALTMEKLHLDIWVENDCEIGIVPIYGGAGLVTDDTRRVKRALLGQQWNSIDLVLATDYAELNLASIFQFKLDQATTTEFYLDNVYFYRESAIVDDDTPYNVSGNMASQSYFSVTLALSATDDSGAVTYIIENGGAQVASTSGASDATVNVKIDNLASGKDYVFSVIAKDGSDNAADAINVNASTLAAPAPAPTPTHAAAAVKSLYSNAYTPVVAVGNYCEWWWESPTVHTNHVLGVDDNVLFYDNNHAAGASFGWSWSADNKIDFSGYQKLHMHIYPSTSGTIEIYPVIDPQGEFHKVSQTLTAGQWNEVVLDYTEKTFAPLNQIGFVNFYNLGEFFVDNVYFFKEPEMVRDDNWMAPGELGTICIPQGAVATGGDIYELLGKDENGKIVFATVANNEMTPGKPYLFEAKSNAMRFFYTSATPASEPVNTGAMKGTFAEVTLTGSQLNNVYYFAGHALWSCVDLTSTGLHVSANRAWVVIDESMPPVNTSSPMPGRRIMTMNVNSKNTPTAIDQVNSSDAVRKVIIDGTLYILRGEKLYDATGRLVK